jgi:hypothetical protein
VSNFEREVEDYAARSQARSDQEWAKLKEHSTSIERIAMSGPRAGDEEFVQRVFCAVAADLVRSQANEIL